jgi:hypothetical protein
LLLIELAHSANIFIASRNVRAQRRFERRAELFARNRLPIAPTRQCDYLLAKLERPHRNDKNDNCDRAITENHRSEQTHECLNLSGDKFSKGTCQVSRDDDIIYEVDKTTILILGSSVVERSTVNRLVASSSLARGVRHK